MHDYETCLSNDHDPAPDVSQQIVSAEEPPNEHFGGFGAVSEVSSVDSSLYVSDDETLRSRPSTEVEAHQTTKQHPIYVDNGETPHQSNFSGPTRPNAAWRLQTTTIGFYALSLTLAITHCGIFMYLDGRVLSPGFPVAEKRTNISQGYVTTISLLLTTAFRASLVASVGVCYTQYLWATVRARALRADLIEDLFQIQTNASHLKNLDLYLKTPVLAAVAVFCWLVPIATVYPPSALVVELHRILPQTQFNVSVFHAKDFMFDTAPKALSSIYCNIQRDKDGNQLTDMAPLSDYPEQASNASFLRTCEFFSGGLYDAQYVTRSTLMSGEIATLSQPGGDNSSYALEFWGPSLECSHINHTVERPVLPADIDVSTDPLQYDPAVWSVKRLASRSELRSNIDINLELADISIFDSTTITYRETEYPESYQYYPCLEDAERTPPTDRVFGRIDLPETGIKVLLPVKDITCYPKIKKYSVTISSTGGTQLVSYTLQDDEPIPAYSRRFANFEGSYRQWVQFSDAMSIYHGFVANLNRSVVSEESPSLSYTGLSRRSAPHTVNGTTVETCQLDTTSTYTHTNWRPNHDINYLEIWPLSVFVRRLSPHKPFIDYPAFDADLAKELLINSTINVLALNQRFDIVNGTISRPVNVYRFRNKLAFFLPYGLSIGLAVPILILGILVFYTHNQETSAITGGFLQLLMTTTGRTDLEDMVVKSTGTMGGYGNVSDELKAAEIRFGELIEAEGKEQAGEPASLDAAVEQESDIGVSQCIRGDQGNVAVAASGVDALEKKKSPLRRVGFGLAHEVRPLRRRNVG